MIYKIDSINNFYLLYATKNHIRYKIISQKDPTKAGEKVSQGNCYDFDLTGILSNDDVMPSQAGCVNVDSVTKVCIEDSIYNLYSVKNVTRLYFSKK